MRKGLKVFGTLYFAAPYKLHPFSVAFGFRRAERLGKTFQVLFAAMLSVYILYMH